MLSAHYSVDNTDCFVNTCPLHIDLCIWWIAFSSLNKQLGVCFADTVCKRILFGNNIAQLKYIVIYCSGLTFLIVIQRDVNYCCYHV